MKSNKTSNLEKTLLESEKLKFINSISNIEDLHDIKILLAYVRGSHMYGTATEKSDVDITFVYQQPTEDILRGDYKEQITVGGNDIVGYEIERFLRLLSQNNPNILEALDIPEDCLIYKNGMIELKQEDWVSKLTEKTILGYAQSQVKKATGLNKKMNNPIVSKKDLIDFCYIIDGDKSQPFREWAEEKQKDLNIKSIEKSSGLVKIPNGKGLYGLYLDVFKTQNFRGILKDEESTQLRTSSIPKDYFEIPYTLWYNQDGYETWKKEYNSYEQWKEERNEDRFNTNSSHGKNYDSKNMMHLFRLLDMAFTVAFTGKIKTRSEDVQWLMEIRNGEVEYDELLQNAEDLKHQISILYSMSDLPETVDFEKTKDLILKFRLNKKHEYKV